MGGVHGALVAAVSGKAFSDVIGTPRPQGTMALVGLPPGGFRPPIFETVLKWLTVRGSIVGTRRDLAESLAPAADRAARPHRDELETVNAVFGRMREGAMEGRVVLRP